MTATFNPLTSAAGTGGVASVSSSSPSTAATGALSPVPLPLTPIIFCGPGSNLYPLCDPSSSTSTEIASSLAESLPKSLLPIANRPLISFPLQHLVSAGIRHAIVLAPANQHQVIETALRGVRLQVPNVGASLGTSLSSTPYLPSLKGASESSNIAVVNGLSPSVSASASSSSSKDVAIRVQLLPLGPYDTLGSSLEADGPLSVGEEQGESDDNSEDDAGSDAPVPFRHIARPGTAELLRWLDSIGKLEADPLVMPVDFIAPSIPLSTFLLSYYSSKSPASPTVTTLLYERGAGESVGRDREKEGPARLVSAYSIDGNEPRHQSSLLSRHELLFLSEPPTATSSNSSLDVRLSLLRHRPRARISTNLLDSHVYILRRDQVIPLLKARRDLTSLREHVVPFIAKTSWQRGLLDKSGWRESLKREARNKARGRGRGADEDEAGEETSGESLMRLAFQRSSLGGGGDEDVDGAGAMDIRAVTIVARLSSSAPTLVPSPEDEGQTSHGNANPNTDDGSQGQEERFFARANTLPTYLECNRFLLRSLASSGATGGQALYFPLPSLIVGAGTDSLDSTHDSSTSSNSVGVTSSSLLTTSISPSSQLSPDTLYTPGAPLQISDRVSLKRCLISPHVRIGRSCRISGSILMDGSMIADGCKMENCIVGPGVRIAERCVLRDVDLGPGARVRKGWEGRGDKIGRGEGESEDEESESGGEESD